MIVTKGNDMDMIIEDITGYDLNISDGYCITYDFNIVGMFDEVLEDHDLIYTIVRFCIYIDMKFDIMADYTFGHIVLGDYNLGDGSIDFCLKNATVMDWFYQQYKDKDNVDYLSENNWENYNWYLLVDGTTLIIVFLEWLKTIPEDDRYDVMEKYWGVKF